MHNQLVLHIGPGLMPDFMTRALFHSILAWPTAKKSASFQRISEELMSDVIRRTENHDLAIIPALQTQWPQLSWRSIEARAQKKRKPAYGYLNKRLKQRMAAARVEVAGFDWTGIGIG